MNGKSYECEPLVLSPKLKTLDEEEDRRDTYVVGPLGTKDEEKLWKLKGRKDSHEREPTEQIL